MKKFYLAAVALLMGATAASAGINFTFSNGMEGWTAGDNATITNGVLYVNMTLSNDKYRQDLGWKSSNEGAPAVSLTTSDRYVAIKWQGAKPTGGQITWELNIGDQGWYNTKWKNNAGQTDIATTAGNTVTYIDLGADDKFAELVNGCALNTFNIKIADFPEANGVDKYAVDWIRSFATVEEVEAACGWKDDATDTGSESKKYNVVNETTGEGYANLADAIAACPGDADNPAESATTLVLYEDQTVASRINPGACKNIIVKGDTPARAIIDGTSNICFVVEKKTSIVFEGLTFKANGEKAKNLLEGKNGSTHVEFNNCVIDGFATTNGSILSLYDGSNGALNNVTFNGCSTTRTDVFLGSSNYTLNGNCADMSVYLEKTFSVTAGESLQGPVTLMLQNYEREETAPVVKGTTNTSLFVLADSEYQLVADEDANALTVKKTSGVSTVEAAANNAPVEYYTIQGVKVAEENLTPGLYIRRQGATATKFINR